MRKIVLAALIFMGSLFIGGNLFASLPAPPSLLTVSSCSNGQVAIYNSTSGKFDSCAGLSPSGGSLTTNLTLAANGTTTAPLTFQTGSLLTSATAGTMEFSSGIFYIDTAASTRYSIPMAPAAGPVTIAGPTGAITMTVPNGSFTAARTDAANTFTGHQTIEGVTSAGATGTSNIVFSTSPAFTTDIHAASVGGATLGTSTLPFGSIYFAGQTGPYSIQLTGTPTANRVVTFGDYPLTFGTMTDTKVCTYSASGTTLSCTSNAVSGTSPAFTTDIHAVSVGGATLGTAALPFGSAYVAGQTGPYSVQITGTPTANRTLTLADGNTVLVAGTMAPATSPAFTTDIHAASVGGTSLGTSALPFSNIYFAGQAGPYSIELTGTPSANRTVTFADGNTTLVAGTMAPTTSPILTTASITPQAYDGHANASPTAAQLSNAIVSNYGQSPTSSGTVTVTAPTLVAGMNFVMIQGTALTSTGAWRLDAGASSLYLDGSSTAQRYATFTAQPVSSSLSCFSFQTGSSTWCLKCTTLSGTSTGS